MKRTLALIHRAQELAAQPVIAVSGGADSTVLLDIVYRLTPYRPPLIWTDTGMEYPETRAHVEKLAKRYRAVLHVAKPTRTPREQWQRQGWPMLGKMAAAVWNRRHADAGFRLNVSACCRTMKIVPARKLTRELGSTLQLTGQRGAADDRLRGIRAHHDGPIHFVKADKLLVANPLQGWTDAMIRRYTREARLAQHPAKVRGAITIGCVYCGGGAQYETGGYRILRHTWPEAWRRFMVDWAAGEIMIALKYDCPLATTKAAINKAGGLEALADKRPWIFDYARRTPIPVQYDR